jgi:hypothetical protein
MSKHTKGPWKAGTTYEHGEPVGAVVRSGVRFVAECPTGVCGHHQPECEANAALIAAAPDLLAACREALEDYAGCNVDRFTQHETDKMNRLRAAIAKAEGCQ